MKITRDFGAGTYTFELTPEELEKAYREQETNYRTEDARRHILDFAGYDEEGKDRQYCAVHGHGYGHLIQRNTTEEDVHIKHGANRYACFTNVANYTRVICIIATVGR